LGKDIRKSKLRGMKKDLGVVNMLTFCTVRIYQTAHAKYMRFIALQFCLNRVNFWSTVLGRKLRA
jgi:hypothetical protein